MLRAHQPGELRHAPNATLERSLKHCDKVNQGAVMRSTRMSRKKCRQRIRRPLPAPNSGTASLHQSPVLASASTLASILGLGVLLCSSWSCCSSEEGSLFSLAAFVAPSALYLPKQSPKGKGKSQHHGPHTSEALLGQGL